MGVLGAGGACSSSNGGAPGGPDASTGVDGSPGDSSASSTGDTGATAPDGSAGVDGAADSANPSDGAGPSDGADQTDGGLADSAIAADSGAAITDSGAPADSSAPVDSGKIVDSGVAVDSAAPVVDSGTIVDSGVAVDSTAPVDSGAGCVTGSACTPASPDPCGVYQTDCGSGSAVCTRIGNQLSGHVCSAGGAVCASDGTCGTCEAGGACALTGEPCLVGALTCSNSIPVCTATSAHEPDNTFCLLDMLCSAGACVSSGPWLTRGEDDRTFTGGVVYSQASDSATVAPVTSDTVAFTPSSGGLNGSLDLRVSGVIPPQVPASNLFPIAGLGMTFTNPKAPFDATAKGSGLDFFVKSTTAVTLQVNLADISTDASFSVCTTSTAPTVVNSCYDYPLATCNVPGGGIWTECHLLWSDFVRPDFGNLGAGLPVDPTQVTLIQINPTPTPAGAPATSFDFAVDDVSFLP